MLSFRGCFGVFLLICLISAVEAFPLVLSLWDFISLTQILLYKNCISGEISWNINLVQKGVMKKEEILSSSKFRVPHLPLPMSHPPLGLILILVMLFLRQQIMEGLHLVAHQEFLPAILLGIPSQQQGTWAPQLERRKKERRSGGSGNRGAQRTKILSSRDYMRYNNTLRWLCVVSEYS